MACPIRGILNPVDRSPKRALSSESQSPAASQRSTEAPPESDSPYKRRPFSSTEPSSVDHRQEIDRTINLSAANLSPQHGSIYNRRLLCSGKPIPVLSSPKRRKLVEGFTDPAAVPSLFQVDSGPEPFNIFQAILKNPELTFDFTKQLEVDDLVSLYAISKDFHYLANRRLTALILGVSVTRCPESSRTFIFSCYRDLCLHDPNRTQLEGAFGMVRTIPSFRWLRMVLHREYIVDVIVRCLYCAGLRLPKRATLVLKKLWFTLDLSDNSRRATLMHNTAFWSDKDIFVATMFILKLDMRLTDPITGHGKFGLRRLLLNQRSLSTLARVLERDEMLNTLGETVLSVESIRVHDRLITLMADLIRFRVKYDYTPPVPPQQSILGVPPHEVGKLQYEGWGLAKRKFIPIDDLICREALKRRLDLHHYYLDMMIYGHIQKRTFRNIKNPAPGTFAGQEPLIELWPGLSISPALAEFSDYQSSETEEEDVSEGSEKEGSDVEDAYEGDESEDGEGDGRDIFENDT